MPLYMDLYYNYMRVNLGDEAILTHEFCMLAFINIADEQSEGAAPFKKVNSNDIIYLSMKTIAI